jgi:hypothetical protein
MIIYRFRLTSEDHDDFLREIEIQPAQTFLDFHLEILSCTNLDNCENALFYTTDNKFKKKQEFSFKYQKKLLRKYDEDIDQVVTETYVPHLMEKSVLKNFIDDPHQLLIYEFTGKDSFVFFIELFKIIKTDECFRLPRCIKANGELPRKSQVPVDTEKPTTGPVIIIPPTVSSPGDKSMFTKMIEDDSELSDIESHLDEILEEETLILPGENASSSEFKDEDAYTEEDENPEQLENPEDYDDIEDLENKHRDLDSESDDY